MAPPRSSWLIAGRGCAAAGWVLWIAVQVVADDPFPPEISLSQYGLGGAGWLFSLWVVVLATGPLLLLRFLPVGIGFVLRYAARAWWMTGCVLIAAAAVVGVLVLLAAAGLDSAGLGPA